MRRETVTPRKDWAALVEAQGFSFHTPKGEPYWDETAAYVFDAREIDLLEQATGELNEMCLAAVEYVITDNLFDEFHIPPRYHDWIRRSWTQDEHTIYGRFDLAYTPGGTPRLLEYNADTPTALLEAAVIQWFWLQDTHPGHDQFNSIHERLIETWQTLVGQVASPVYFASLRNHDEDIMTVSYLRETARQAGLETEYLAVEDIAWNPRRRQFVDQRERPIRTLFKLYPWEWMLKEEFGPHLLVSNTRWLEPPWKMLLSNKAILSVLWELFPDSPYLVRAAHEPFGATYVRKPLLGREGANVVMVRDNAQVIETGGPYEGPAIYQELCPLPQFAGNYAIIGSWIVNGHACGIGIREDIKPVTGNTSRFVPHYIG